MGDMVSFWDSEHGDLGNYNLAFLKRARCFICNTNNENGLEHWIYRVQFSKYLEKFKETEDYEYFKEIKAGYYESKYMCDNCLHEFFHSYPAIFRKIELVIPR